MALAYKLVTGRPESEAQDLEAYKLAYDLSLELHKISLHLPQQEQTEMGREMRRASKEIVLHLAEGYSKQSQLEFARFISQAVASAKELKVWLNYTHDLKYLPHDQIDWLQEQYDRTILMLQNLRMSVFAKNEKRITKEEEHG